MVGRGIDPNLEIVPVNPGQPTEEDGMYVLYMPTRATTPLKDG